MLNCQIIVKFHILFTNDNQRQSVHFIVNKNFFFLIKKMITDEQWNKK